MAGITTCQKCGQAYEAGSEEQANEPSGRRCIRCRLDEGGVAIGPVITDIDGLERWILSGHVTLCSKRGVDCKACAAAAALGIPCRGIEA